MTGNNPEFGKLRHVVRYCPVVDNHAHNLLRVDQLASHDFLACTSEAEGAALGDAKHSLAHLKASRQLCSLFDLPQNATWENVLQIREEVKDKSYFIKRCFDGIHTILIDDGLGDHSMLETYDWHSRFTSSPCKRIVRIETVATEIFTLLHDLGQLPTGANITDEDACSEAWSSFVTEFGRSINTALTDSEVVGFKSVICYRTGLDVQPRKHKELHEEAFKSFRRQFLPHCVDRNFRIEQKEINDALVVLVCHMITTGFNSYQTAKPFQFHTGLGDNDISLLVSSPAHLQPLIEAFPEVPIVLLHSSYPYTREAGYLATVFKNVYLDIGEVFPMVSRDGQESIIREALHLTPVSKILWSTDGHYFPETYWLANVQGRIALEKVLCEYVANDDMTEEEAIDAAKSILFTNSNDLYDLNLGMPMLENWPVVAPSEKPMTTINTDTESTSTPAVFENQPEGLSLLTQFTSKHRGIHFIFVQWLDYNATLRCRCLPIDSFERLIRKQERLSISYGNLGTTQTDQMTPACVPIGSIYVEPDLQSLKPMQDNGQVKNAATVMGHFTDINGVGLEECPRASLKRLVRSIETEHHLNFLVGFEIEITFCRRIQEGSRVTFAPLDTVHAWCSFTDEQYLRSMNLMMLITTSLQLLGIPVEQFHSEAGAGQYEFVLPPLPPLRAVDTLIQAKQCIQQIAASQGLRATCHPMPFHGVGTAAHAHISFNSSTLSADRLDAKEMSFMSSVLAHLPAICMITLPQSVSYERVVEDSWTGGVWVAWGTQNREVPLRRVKNGRWEVRCLDGCANMYLALYALISAGLAGMKRDVPMEMEDCVQNPSKLSAEERRDLGITTKLPKSIEESIEAFRADVVFTQSLGTTLRQNLVVMKRYEQNMLAGMPEAERRSWLIERY